MDTLTRDGYGGGPQKSYREILGPPRATFAGVENSHRIGSAIYVDVLKQKADSR